MYQYVFGARDASKSGIFIRVKYVVDSLKTFQIESSISRSVTHRHSNYRGRIAYLRKPHVRLCDGFSIGPNNPDRNNPSGERLWKFQNDIVHMLFVDNTQNFRSSALLG